MSLFASKICRLVFPLTFVVACQTTKINQDVLQGNEYAKDGLLREAAESYQKAIKADAAYFPAYRNLGMIYVKMGEYKRATRNLEISMESYENDFDANYYLGEAYRGQDKYAEAIFRYKKSLTIRKDDPRALKPLAWSYFKIRYYSEALVTARKLSVVAKDDDQTSIILARTLLKLKRPREALAVIKKGKSKIKRSSLPYYHSVEGDIQYEMGHTKLAIKNYRAALKVQPLLAGALLGLGKSMLKNNQDPKAITYLERAIRIRPRLTEAYFLLGKVYENKDRQKSLQYYRSFRKQASADPEFLAMMNEVKSRMTKLHSNSKSKNL